MQLERDRPTSLLKASLSAVLAFLLVAAATVSVCQVLHQAIHEDGSQSHPLCLACAVAKAQMSAAEAAPIFCAVSLGILLPGLIAFSPRLQAADFCFARDRAPPRA